MNPRAAPLLAAALAGCTAVPAMVRVPAGAFTAGSPATETAAVHYPAANAAREQPQRRVSIDHAFAIGRTEVTRRQFARFARAVHFTPDGPCSFETAAGTWQADRAHDWQHPGFRQTGAHPVVCVSFADAQAYAGWLSTATGRRLRLPGGDEWEYAARAGTSGPRWWSGWPGPDCAYGNLSDQSRARTRPGGQVDPDHGFACDDGHAETAPVARFRPNPWGLYDVIGNVWEWTSDCEGPADDPCRSRLDRGASWGNSPKYVRSAARHPDLAGARTTVLGFRLVEDLR